MASAELPVPDGLVVRPFRGVRFTVADPAAVTSPPYDLISSDDVRRLLAVHPNNVVRLILPGGAEHRYERAAATLRAWLASGVLAMDPSPALYVYEQRGPGVLQRGLIGAVALSPPERRVILPHEDVMPGPVADRLALMRATRADLEPIFLLHPGAETASRLVDEVADGRAPLTDLTADDGLRHRLWAVTAPAEISRITADLRDRRALIADGHHRYATRLAFQREAHAAGAGAGPWDHGLALLVDLAAYPPRVHAIHRVVPALPLAEAVRRARGSWRVREHASVEEALSLLAGRPGPAFVLAGDGPAALLSDPDPERLARAMPAGRSARWRSLATAVLAEFLLPRVWGIADDEHAVRIVHQDAAEAVRQARRCGGTAVLMNPPQVTDVFAVAAQGERVPRKSTFFTPKPRTGLVMRLF